MSGTGNDTPTEILVDARGLRCPWPALRLARAMREGGAGACVRIVADDPAAPRELAALAAEQGWHIVPFESAGTHAFSVSRAAPVNSVFTPLV